jgi:hypothetical protein
MVFLSHGRVFPDEASLETAFFANKAKTAVERGRFGRIAASGRVGVNPRHRHTERSHERSLTCLLALEEEASLLCTSASQPQQTAGLTLLVDNADVYLDDTALPPRACLELGA